MRVTVYTDAGFCSRRMIGAWGAWCRSDKGRVQGSGRCSPAVSTSFQAELQACVEGVRLAKATWPETSAAIVVSDCDGVKLHIERDRSLAKHPLVRSLLEQLDGLGVEIEARWVKGHQRPTDGTQAWLNVAVDGLASIELQRAREELDAEKNPRLATLRRELREALLVRYGTGERDVAHARRWAAGVLGLKRIKVGMMSAEQCALVLQALARSPLEAQQ
ncbi:RNase H family protein [Sorangium sp. So ce134]